MHSEIETTNNSLADIVNWLKKGFIVCLHTNNKQLFYFSSEKLDKIENEKLIYVNASTYASLLEDDEWPWYIKNAGFVDYRTTSILPTNKEHMCHFTL